MPHLIVALASILMVALTTLMFYECMRLVWDRLPTMTISPRLRILGVILGIFIAHTVAIWMFGTAYWLLANFPSLGHLSADDQNWIDFVYFSASTYSSLGFDVAPAGAMRMLTGVEVLDGLVLIGWSVSFTYLAMEKFWNAHPTKKK